MMPDAQPDVDAVWEEIFDAAGQQNINGLHGILADAKRKWVAAETERCAKVIREKCGACYGSGRVGPDKCAFCGRPIAAIRQEVSDG